MLPDQAAHPALAGSRDLQAFLEASEEEWAAEVARASYEAAGGNAAQKAVASTLARLKNLGQQTQSLVSGKHADEEEDPEYLKVWLLFCCLIWHQTNGALLQPANPVCRSVLCSQNVMWSCRRVAAQSYLDLT